VGVSSDIGRELALRYAAEGWTVWGTHRNIDSSKLPTTVRTIHCDLMCPESLMSAVEVFVREGLRWDLMVIAAGTEEPIGPFFECDELAWEGGIQVNALAPLRLIRRLYPMRNQGGSPSVAFFSGSGTNNAAPAYSAYCASKIMLIKMCELLNAESGDTSFFIVGPGIVRTKIHEQTLRAPERSGENYRKVVGFMNSDDPGTAHDDIYACMNWCHSAGKAVIGGRNLSLVYDAWRNGGDMLAGRLAADGNLYKLRRFGNDIQIVTTKI
jgi:NAD(P)-dependent dehydrogenase (short-subunit alcohol dehydrogenase family)